MKLSRLSRFLGFARPDVDDIGSGSVAVATATTELEGTVVLFVDGENAVGYIETADDRFGFTAASLPPGFKPRIGARVRFEANDVHFATQLHDLNA